MKSEQSYSERQMLDQFLEDIRALPNMNVELIETELSIGINERIDALVEIRVGGRSTTLLVEVKRSIFPRDVREALWRVRHFADDVKKQLKLRRLEICVVAEAISPGAKSLLQNEHVGYYDLGGSIFLSTSAVYVYVDKPPPKRIKRSIRSVFSGRRAQVLHAILLLDQDWFSVKDIALKAQVSQATASQVVNALERFDWLVSRGRGPNKERLLEKPSELLNAWSNQLDKERSLSMRRYFVPQSRTESLVDRFSDICKANNAEYAVTHVAAAQRYAPFVTTVSQLRCRLLANKEVERCVIEQLDARIVDHGANLELIRVFSSGELLFRQMVNGIWLANPIQVYLDLKRSEGRGKEIAEHLRKERIGF